MAVLFFAACNFREEIERVADPMLSGQPIQYSTIRVHWEATASGPITIEVGAEQDCRDPIVSAVVEADATEVMLEPPSAGDYTICARHSDPEVTFKNQLQVSLRKGWYHTDLQTMFPSIARMSRATVVEVGDSLYVWSIRDAALEFRYILRFEFLTDTWTLIDVVAAGLPAGVAFSLLTDGETLWAAAGAEIYVYDGATFTLAAQNSQVLLESLQFGFRFINGKFWGTTYPIGGRIAIGGINTATADVGPLAFQNLIDPQAVDAEEFFRQTVSRCMTGDATRYLMVGPGLRSTQPQLEMLTFVPGTPTAEIKNLETATGPPPRGGIGCAMTADTLYYFGGSRSSDTTIRSDLWSYDFAAGLWTEFPRTDPNYPVGRNSPGMIAHQRGLAIVGGVHFLAPGDYVNDAYFYYP
jgi:hypothetical protein